MVGPLLGTGGQRVVPSKRTVANSFTSLVMEIDGLLPIGRETIAGIETGTRMLAGGLVGLLDRWNGGRLGVEGPGSVLLRNIRLLVKFRLLRATNTGGLGRVTSIENVASVRLQLSDDLIVYITNLPVIVVRSSYDAGSYESSDVDGETHFCVLVADTIGIVNLGYKVGGLGKQTC